MSRPAPSSSSNNWAGVVRKPYNTPVDSTPKTPAADQAKVKTENWPSLGSSTVVKKSPQSAAANWPVRARKTSSSSREEMTEQTQDLASLAAEMGLDVDSLKAMLQDGDDKETMKKKKKAPAPLERSIPVPGAHPVGAMSIPEHLGQVLYRWHLPPSKDQADPERVRLSTLSYNPSPLQPNPEEGGLAEMLPNLKRVSKWARSGFPESAAPDGYYLNGPLPATKEQHAAYTKWQLLGFPETPASLSAASLARLHAPADPRSPEATTDHFCMQEILDTMLSSLPQGAASMSRWDIERYDPYNLRAKAPLRRLAWYLEYLANLTIANRSLQRLYAAEDPRRRTLNSGWALVVSRVLRLWREFEASTASSASEHLLSLYSTRGRCQQSCEDCQHFHQVQETVMWAIETFMLSLDLSYQNTSSMASIFHALTGVIDAKATSDQDKWERYPHTYNIEKWNRWDLESWQLYLTAHQASRILLANSLNHKAAAGALVRVPGELDRVPLGLALVSYLANPLKTPRNHKSTVNGVLGQLELLLAAGWQPWQRYTKPEKWLRKGVRAANAHQQLLSGMSIDLEMIQMIINGIAGQLIMAPIRSALEERYQTLLQSQQAGDDVNNLPCNKDRNLQATTVIARLLLALGPNSADGDDEPDHELKPLQELVMRLSGPPGTIPLELAKWIAERAVVQGASGQMEAICHMIEPAHARLYDPAIIDMFNKLIF
jgi:hypothetical protein